MFCAGFAALLFGTAMADVTSTPQPQADGDTEAFPISVEVKPRTALVGATIAVSGTTLTILNNDVGLTVSSPSATPPQSTRLTAHRGEDGSFKTSFRPSVAGRYTVEAVAPDGKGRSTASFTVENPRQLSPASASAFTDLAQDANDLAGTARKKIAALPPSPGRDQATQKLDGLITKLGELVVITRQVSQLVPPMIEFAPGEESRPPSDTNTTVANQYTVAGGGTVAGNTSLGGDGQVAGNMSVALKKVVADRDKLVETLGEVAQMHQRSQEQLHELKKNQIICDNLEVVTEGLKLVGAMLNVAKVRAFDVVNEFRDDYLAAFAADQIQGRLGSDQLQNRVGGQGGGFLAGQLIKNKDSIKEWNLELDDGIGMANDLVAFAVDRVMEAYCEQFSGPVTAHMHATFIDEASGMQWWEYSFDVRGQLSLRYPKDASGESVPLKGRIEGYATNFKLWEEALRVKYRKQMTGTVLKRIKILPVSPADTKPASVLLKQTYSVEGSAFTGLLTPSSFFFEINGTATEHELNIQVGPSRWDTNAKARVLALWLPVLTLQIGYDVYSFDYKPVHFVFERAASAYTITLNTKDKVIRGKQHFENKKSNSEAIGEYSVDIEACNPGC